MNNYNDLLVYLLVIVNIVFLFLGYIIGILSKINSQPIIQSQCISTKEQKKQIEKEKIIEKIQSIDIDETKIVIETDLSGLEKKFDDIGEVKEVNDNIDTSVNKLSKLMKGK